MSSFWNSESAHKNEFVPDNASLLSNQDLENYRKLRQAFFSESGKSKKGERLDLLTQKLDKIRLFINNGNPECWRRSVVCGIFFLKNSLAINIQALRTLLGKCKSSINGSLQQLGYIAQPQTLDFENELAQQVPPSMRSYCDLKKWTMRVLNTEKPKIIEKLVLPIISTQNDPIFSSIDTTTMYNEVETKFPCPIKCRYKIYDILSSCRLI